MSLTGLAQAMTPLEPKQMPFKEKPELQVSMLIPAKGAGHALEKTVTTARQYLATHFPDSFEIIIIPTVERNSTDPTLSVAQDLAQRFRDVKVCPHYLPIGKGAALRTGFLTAKGEWIFFTDADLPYDLTFFDQAVMKLRAGFDFITGNRRIPTSYFDVPVDLLNLAYKRHSLGILFNRFARTFLPIQATDTQAGIKAMSRRFALEAFRRQTCPGFFFDLEFFLTCTKSEGLDRLPFLHAELPVTLHLNTEKSTVRVLRESLLAVYWLTRITLRNFFSGYGAKSAKGISTFQILSRYERGSLGTRFFLLVRWVLTPYQAMAAELPPRGEILDLGSGHGLLSLAAALGSPGRRVLGIDHDQARVKLAARAGYEVKNLRFEEGTFSKLPQGKFKGIALIDVMHYFTPDLQTIVIKGLFELLERDGRMIVREVEPTGGPISKWNRLYEKIATRIGFTQSEGKSLHFRSRAEWEEFFTGFGFKVTSRRCSSFLFADVLYICERVN